MISTANCDVYHNHLFLIRDDVKEINIFLMAMLIVLVLNVLFPGNSLFMKG